jgi:D-cysteine desulfhydrase
MCVLNPRGVQEELVYGLMKKTADYAGMVLPVERDEVVCRDEYLGPGYTLPTPAMIEAVRLLASTEGILLDPSYTGKAMAGLIDLVRKGEFPAGSNILFVHTGGYPALFASTDLFQNK